LRSIINRRVKAPVRISLWPLGGQKPIFTGVSYLSRFSPARAYRDLRLFFSYRQPHELIFLLLAMLFTGVLIAGFYYDSKMEKPYERPEIMYFESWPEDRTDAQIKAQQAIDKVKQDKQLALLKQKQEERKAEFKRLNDKLESWGL
jgi:hypothetical protein